MSSKNDTSEHNKHTIRFTSTILNAASFILSLAAIPLLVLSIERIHTVQHLSVCMMYETSTYRIAHSLCPILPALAIILAIFSLLRLRRSKATPPTKLLAVSALLLPIVSLTIHSIKEREGIRAQV